MGLDIVAKGLARKDGYHASYGGYYWFRVEIVRRCYGEYFIDIFRNDNATKEECEAWNKICDDDLDIFLLHSDCEGKFTPKECRKVYNALCRIETKEDDPERFTKDLELWKGIFLHCAKRRVNLYYC